MRKGIVIGALAAGAIALALACSGSSKSALSVSARGAATAANPPAGTTSLVLDNGIVIQRVRVVVRKVEVDGPDTVGKGTCSDEQEDGHDASTSGTSGTTDTSGTTGTTAAGTTTAAESDGDRCEDELEFGPFLVDLSGAELAGGVHFQFDVPVPAGTYEEIEFKVGPITAAKAGTDAGLKAMADLGASLVVDGTVDGKPFSFVTPARLELEREGVVAVSTSKGAAITFDVDATGWFGGKDAARLDPTVAANADAILANIRASLRIVHDDDRDGCDDDHADSGPGCTGDHHD